MIGRTLSHYRVLAQIGAGGMGVVYRARDLHLERDVALKVLPPGTLGNDNARQRFRREALVLSKLNHPHINAVHDFDHQDGVDFLVMELVPGASLAEKLRAGPLAEAEAVSLAIQIAQALDAAHESGVVHRDLKPANIMVTPKGDAKVLDFGLAKRFDPAGARIDTTTLTEPRAATGTLPYMAPEQLLGGDVDGRADLYALGVVMYEMAIGKRPFDDPQPVKLANAILNHAVEPPRRVRPDLSPRFEAIVLRCLEKDRGARCPSARALLDDLTSTRAVASARRRGRGLVWLVAAAVLGAMIIVAAFDVGGLRTQLFGGSSLNSLAVLPLRELSAAASENYFADGMTEELTSSLAGIGGLRVISSQSTLKFRGSTLPVSQIARVLGVKALVVGSVRRVGDRVRIAVQLVEAASDRDLWNDTFERNMSDALSLQSEVAQAIAAGIRVKITTGERSRLSSTRRVDPAAHDEYLKGRYFMNKFTRDGELTAVEHFRRAIDLDPTLAVAYAGLANAYLILNSAWIPPKEAMPLARAATERALELSPDLAEAVAARGYVRGFYDWKWQPAELDFRRAIALAPGSAVPHNWYGYMLVIHGRFQEARREFDRAAEIDPLSPLIRSMRLYALYQGRRYDDAIAAARQVVAEDSTAWNAWGVMGQAYAAKRQFDQAAFCQRRSQRAAGDTSSTNSALWYALTGQRERALRELERDKAAPMAGTGVAWVYAALGMRDSAFAYLDRDVEARNENVLYSKVDPALDYLRSDARFPILLKRLGLTP